MNAAIAQTCSTLAYLLNQEGKYDESLTFSSRAIAVKPDDDWGYFEQGIAHAEQGNYHQAVSDYSRAITLKPDSAPAYNNRGNAHYSQGHFDEAVSDHTCAIALKPDYALAYYNRGLTYQTQQHLDEAISDYSRALALKPDYALAYYNRGNIYRKQGNFDKAIADYSRTISLKPDYTRAYYQRAYTSLRLKNIEQARVDFVLAAKLEPYDVASAWMRVFTSLTREKPDLIELAERLEKIAALDPKDGYADTCLAIAIGLRGRLKEGLAKLDQILHDYPKSGDDYFWKGIFSAYYYPGKSHIAVEAIDKALENGLPPVLLTSLYWLQQDRPAFFEQYAKPLLEKYGV